MIQAADVAADTVRRMATTPAAPLVGVLAAVAFLAGVAAGGQGAQQPGSAPLRAAPLRSAPSVPAARLPRFERVTFDGLDASQRATSCAGNVAGSAWADIDADGHLDVYLPEPEGQGQLCGGPRFVRESLQAAGIPPLAAGAASFADVDGDGRPDLYVAARGRDRLLRGLGRGRFVDITSRSRADDPGSGTSVAWADDDGDSDLVVANDHLGFRPNELWRNDTAKRGPWRFTRVGRAWGAAPALASMGIGSGDLDGDGRIDLVVTDMGHPPLVLLRDHGRFALRRLPVAQANPSPTAWGVVVADLNNDGAEDVVAAAGALGLDGGFQPDLLYLGDGRGAFREAGSASGLGDPGRGRGVGVVDLDTDGNLDLVVTRLGQPPLLYVNRGPRDRARAHWLELRLDGAVGACGARVEVRAVPRTFVREHSCDPGAPAKVVHFGLAAARRADVRVRWPSGRVQRLRGVRADRQVTLVEPR